MNVRQGHRGQEAELIALFAATFGAAEGDEEGTLIGQLVRNLLTGTDDEDLFVFTALEDGLITGAIVFSRLSYRADARTAFVLGPVAVAPEYQRRGIGQALLAHGLNALRDAGVDLVMTYGDPAYYARAGFEPVAEAHVPAPFALTHPDAWLGQSLVDRPIGTLEGPCACVPAFRNPAFW